MKGTYITVTAEDGGSFKAYLAKPEEAAAPGSCCCRRFSASTRYMREVADLYAEEGYVVLVPDLFWRLEPGVELGYREAEMAEGLRPLSEAST